MNRRIEACRLCKDRRLLELFSLGSQVVSDFVEEPFEYWDCEGCKDYTADVCPHCKGEGHFRRVNGNVCPIELVLCKGCGLVQQRWSADIPKTYWYRSGVTESMKRSLADVVAHAESLVKLEPGDVVLDIGSNDGTLLRNYGPELVRVGVEPAANLTTLENYNGMLVVNDVWSSKAYMEAAIQSQAKGMGMNDFGTKRAKVVTAIGMLYDLEDPQAFVDDVAKVLHPDGVFIAQLMCLKNMLSVNDVGNLAHEHLEFYSLRSISLMLDRAGLELIDVQTNAVNGESYRLVACHKGQFLKAIHRLEKAEMDDDGLDNPNVYSKFKEEMDENKRLLTDFVNVQVSKGKRIHVYGASTKGNVIMQWLGLDCSVIEAASDRSPEKWGKFMVGTGIPIVSEEASRDKRPDFYLVLPYAFIGEFIQRETVFLRRGGVFIVPLPKFKLIGEGAA